MAGAAGIAGLRHAEVAGREVRPPSVPFTLTIPSRGEGRNPTNRLKCSLFSMDRFLLFPLISPAALWRITSW